MRLSFAKTLSFAINEELVLHNQSVGDLRRFTLKVHAPSFVRILSAFEINDIAR